MTTSIVSTIRIDGHDLQWAKRLEEGGFAGRLRAMEVGGDCSDRLTSTDDATKFMEERRKRADKKKRFVQSPRWQVSKNGVHRITQGKIKLEIRQESGGFRVQMAGVRGKRLYAELIEAKVRVFDFIESGEAEEFIMRRISASRDPDD